MFEMIQILSYPTQFIFYTNSQDLCLIMLHNSPELLFALVEFVTTYFGNNTYKFLVSVITNLFTDSVVQKFSLVAYSFMLFFLAVWAYVICINV